MSARRWWCPAHGAPPTVVQRHGRKKCGVCYVNLMDMKPAPAVAPASGKEKTMNGTSVVFVKRDNGPERLETEAEVIFGDEAGPLAGMKLVGFSLWKSPEGELYVTFPSRAFGAGGDRRFFDYLRSVEGSAAVAKRVKEWILSEYRAKDPRATAEVPTQAQ